MKKIFITTLIIATLAILLIPIRVSAVQLNIEVDAFDADAADLGSTGTSVVSTVLGVIQIIGTVASVVVIALVGIKFMLGSPEERFEYKQSLKLYLMGAFIIFNLTWIPQLVFLFITNVL